MNEETRTALRAALVSAFPEKHLNHDWANGDAITDWRKFRSVTDMANQLEAGTIVDPEILICAAEALREFAKKTETAALNRKKEYDRDTRMTMHTGHFRQPLDEHGDPNGEPEFVPAPDRSMRVEEMAVEYGYTDPRGVYMAVKKWISHLSQPRSRY